MLNILSYILGKVSQTVSRPGVNPQKYKLHAESRNLTVKVILLCILDVRILLDDDRLLKEEASG